MFFMVENTIKDQEHCEVLETPLAADTLSLVSLCLMVYIINSGPFDTGFFFGFLVFTVGYKCS